MASTFKAKLMGGAAVVALLALVPATEASAQDSMGSAKPGAISLSLEGGYAIAGGTNQLSFAGVDKDPSTGNGPLFMGSGNGWTGRAGVAYQIRDRWSARLAYTGLRASKRASSPSTANIYTVLGNGVNTGSSGPADGTFASARTKVAVDMVDFQAGYDVGLGSGINGTLLGGLRFASFRQTTDVSLFSPNGSGGGLALEAANHRSSRFLGVGPTVGIKAGMPLGDGGFGLDGSLVGGLLFGHLRSSTTGLAIFPRSISGDQLAGTLEAQLALTYTFPMGLQLGAGYQVSYYSNVRDAQGGIQDVAAPRGINLHNDLLFHGPFARASFRF